MQNTIDFDKKKAVIYIEEPGSYALTVSLAQLEAYDKSRYGAPFFDDVTVYVNLEENYIQSIMHFMQDVKNVGSRTGATVHLKNWP